MWGLSVNVLVWEKFHVNYRLVLRMGSHHSSFAQMVKRNSFFTGLLVFVFLLHVMQESRASGATALGIEYLPFVFYLVFFGYIFFPSEEMFNPRGRKYFYELAYSILMSPLPWVELTFLINWGTDQLVSFAGPLRDLAYTICFYIQDDSHFQCFSTSTLIFTTYIVVLIPLFYRSAQCARLAATPPGPFYKHTQFYNLGKYLTSMLAVTVAYAYKYHRQELLPAYIGVSLASMAYSYYWDLKHDWAFLEPEARYPMLRSKLTYQSPAFYYSIAVANLVLRSAWVVSITGVGTLFNSDILVFFVALLELIRRCLWNFLRVEKEHVANCGSFRTTEDVRALAAEIQAMGKLNGGRVTRRIEECGVVWLDLRLSGPSLERPIVKNTDTRETPVIPAKQLIKAYTDRCDKGVTS